MANVTIQPSTADTKMSEAANTGIFSTDVTLCAVPYAANRYRSIFKFDFSAVVPAGATITLATLSLFCTNTSAARTITVYRLLRTDWVENQATWNIYKTGSNWGTAGALGSGVDFTPTDAATAASVAAGQWLNETVTAQVQAARDSVGGVAHFLMADDGASANVYNFYSNRKATSTANRPKLYIEYSTWTAPNLKPRIGGAVKTMVSGSVRIGGELKTIDSMWARIGGVLKKL